MLIINDKKMIFEGVDIFTHFFTRTHPAVFYCGYEIRLRKLQIFLEEDVIT